MKCPECGRTLNNADDMESIEENEMCCQCYDGEDEFLDVEED